MNVLILRHGPKDESITHITGLESKLLPQADEVIKKYVNKKLVNIVNKDTQIIIYTSPVERAKETAELIYQDLVELKYKVSRPKIAVGFGSYDLIDGKVVNLIPPEMSKIWGTAKREQSKDSKENSPLLAWCNVGYYENFNGTGLSLLEMVSRMEEYIERIPMKENTLNIIVSHSGDIEPFLYYLIAKERGIDLQENPMPSLYFETGKALSPLEGIILEVSNKSIKFVKRI
jgi:broad specificity phosphatase PhoE